MTKKELDKKAFELMLGCPLMYVIFVFFFCGFMGVLTTTNEFHFGSAMAVFNGVSIVIACVVVRYEAKEKAGSENSE